MQIPRGGSPSQTEKRDACGRLFFFAVKAGRPGGELSGGLSTGGFPAADGAGSAAFSAVLRQAQGGGGEGVALLVQKLQGELSDAMAMCGIHSLSEINRDLIFKDFSL